MTIPEASEDAEALLRIAVATAAEAGRLLASWRGDERPEVVQTKSSPTDIVTEMDRRVRGADHQPDTRAPSRRHRPRRGGRPDRGRPGRRGTTRASRGGCAGSSTRWTEPSTTCTACATGRCPSRPRWTARWSPGWSRCRGTARRSPRWPARAPGCTGAKPGWRCAAPRRAARPGPGRYRLRLRRGAPPGPGRGDRGPAAVRPGHPPGRLRRGRPVLGGRRAARRLLRARPELLGLRGRRPDRPRGRRCWSAGWPAGPRAPRWRWPPDRASTSSSILSSAS